MSVREIFGITSTRGRHEERERLENECHEEKDTQEGLENECCEERKRLENECCEERERLENKCCEEIMRKTRNRASRNKGSIGVH